MAVGARDVLAQLLEAKWRGIPFPTTLVQTSGQHDVVMHRRMDRNGRRVENTGFAGYTYSFRAPMINSIARGQNETWQDLYPTTYRKLLTALEDRSTGDWQHPDFGTRKCKVVTFESVLDPEFRGGPTLSVTLCETVDDPDGDAAGLASTSTLAIATQAAVDLDRFLYERPAVDKGTPGGMSLKDFVTSIGSIADQWELFKNQWEAAINRVGYQMEKLGEKFGAEPGFSDNTARLIASLHLMKLQALMRARPTSTHLVTKPTTIAALSIELETSVTDLLKLNPQLVKGPVVPAMTPVRYYA